MVGSGSGTGSGSATLPLTALRGENPYAWIPQNASLSLSAVLTLP